MPDLTSGQKVIGICVSLFLGVLCFAGGVLVGQYDPSIQQRAIEELASKTGGTPAEERQVVQTSPRVDTASNSDGPSAAAGQPRVDTPKNAFTRQSERTGPRVTELPPLPSPTSRPAPATPSAPLKAVTPAPVPPVTPASAGDGPVVTPASGIAPETPLKPAPKPAEPDKPAPAEAPKADPPPSNAVVTQEVDTSALSELEPIVVAGAPEPQKPEAATTTVSPVSPVPTSPAAPATVAKGWGVQLGSFAGDGRQAKAETFIRTVKQSSNLDAAVLPSEDGKLYRVVAVGYADKAAASKIAEDLKKKPEFKDAFVRTVP